MDFTNFITADSLKTFSGQAVAIVALTQLFKEIPTAWLDRVLRVDLRWLALGIAIWIQVVTTFLDGVFLKATLAVLNGGIITLVATKGAEMLKGSSVKQPEVKP